MKLVLSISGGGIRGIIPAIILSDIEKRVGKPISKCFDLIAGTSTGGIIAALLSVSENNKPKYSASQVVELYKQFGTQVFKKNLFRTLITLNGLISTKYSCKPLENLLKSYLGKATLSNTTTNLLIPAYQISNIPYPHFFKTSNAKLQSSNKLSNPKLWQCARATSAANGYFKPFKLDNNHTFLDGGLFANNPAMCAYAQAKSNYGNREKIVIVSIETGENLVGYSYEKIRNWGILQWAIPFFKQTSISSSATIDYMLRTLSQNGDKYYCVQTDLDKQSLRMDDASTENIERLEIAAKHSLVNNSKVISDIINIITYRSL